MISIIIPLYNKEKSIFATIRSVVNQTYTDFELIVVNDGSTDKSLQVVEDCIRKLEIGDWKLKNENWRLKIVSKPNGGVCSARNRGIQEAKGEYVVFLDADDLWDMQYLEEQMRMVNDFPEAAMWGINFAETREGKIIRRCPTGLPDGYRGYVEHYFEIPNRVSDLFHPSSAVIRREVFDKVGLFDERIKYAEDSDMWFRIISNYKVAFYDRYMVKYQQDAENRAMNKQRDLRYFLPYYVDKYRDPLYKRNEVFYRWVNRWAAVHIRRYYFSENEQNRKEAKEAAAKLDYSVIPFKYRLFFHMPYGMAKIINEIDLKRRNEK